MVIERFNRTLRDKITKYMILHKTKKFINEVPQLVKTYNNTEHSTIKMTPQQAKDSNYNGSEQRNEKL